MAADHLPPATMADDAVYTMQLLKSLRMEASPSRWRHTLLVVLRNRKHKASCEDRKKAVGKPRGIIRLLYYLSSPNAVGESLKWLMGNDVASLCSCQVRYL